MGFLYEDMYAPFLAVKHTDLPTCLDVVNSCRSLSQLEMCLNRRRQLRWWNRRRRGKR